MPKWLIKYDIEIEADTWQEANEQAKDYLYARKDEGKMAKFEAKRIGKVSEKMPMVRYAGITGEVKDDAAFRLGHEAGFEEGALLEQEACAEWMEKAMADLLNRSVVTYRFASYRGDSDYRCVEIVMEIQDFVDLEDLLNIKIEGRLGKQYE